MNIVKVLRTPILKNIFEQLLLEVTEVAPMALNPAGIYLLQVNNRCRSGVFIVNFEHISHFAQVFLLLTLNL